MFIIGSAALTSWDIVLPPLPASLWGLTGENVVIVIDIVEFDALIQHVEFLRC